jgi:DNA-binding response OmpR family regulator
LATRVLVVDDEHLIADTMAKILRNAGYESLAAYDGESALRQMESFHPALVISDVLMPRCDGVRTAIAIRDQYPDCMVLLLSGQAGTRDLLEVARHRGYEFELLLKPVHPLALLERVRSLVR